MEKEKNMVTKVINYKISAAIDCCVIVTAELMIYMNL